MCGGDGCGDLSSSEVLVWEDVDVAGFFFLALG